MPTIDLLVDQRSSVLQYRLQVLLSAGPKFEGGRRHETLRNLFSQVFASGWVRDGLSVVWHAGEPTVLPIAFYRDAFAMVESLRPHDLPVVHSFQTNGTLIDEAWCAFFAEAKVNLGVSIDGPRHLHDRNRLTRSGRGTFDRTIAGIRLLRRLGVPST